MNYRLPLRNLIFLSFLSLLNLPAVAQQYYRWVDSEGVSHFSQSPPPSYVDAEVGVLPNSSIISNEVSENQPVSEQQTNTSETLNSFTKDPELCSQILQSLQIMNENQNIVMTDPETGNGFYLSESERAAEKIRLENMRSYYCD